MVLLLATGSQEKSICFNRQKLQIIHDKISALYRISMPNQSLSQEPLLMFFTANFSLCARAMNPL